MKIEQSLRLPVDPEALWKWLSEPERLVKWIPEVQRFELEPPGEIAKGSRLIAHLPKGGEPFEGRVERADRPQALVLRASGLPNDLEVLLEFLVRGHETGSELTLRAEAELTGLLVFAEKMIAPKARAKLATWTEALRAAIAAE